MDTATGDEIRNVNSPDVLQDTGVPDARGAMVRLIRD